MYSSYPSQAYHPTPITIIQCYCTYEFCDFNLHGSSVVEDECDNHAEVMSMESACGHLGHVYSACMPHRTDTALRAASLLVVRVLGSHAIVHSAADA